MTEYALFLNGGDTGVSDPVFYAALMEQLPYARAVLRSLLFANTPQVSFMAATEVNEDVIHAYQRLFFDVGVFPNKLIKMAYARQLPVDNNDEKFERDMMMWGQQLGWEYLVWKVSGGKITMPTQEALQHIMTDSLWRSREHIFSSITDQRAKEAKSWIPHLLRTAEMVEKTNPNRVSSLEELRIKLIGIDTTKSIDDVDPGSIAS